MDATIYIDGMQVGLTRMSFPMPTGRYTLVLFAPGHQPYGQRILVADVPLEIKATFVPLPQGLTEKQSDQETVYDI